MVWPVRAPQTLPAVPHLCQGRSHLPSKQPLPASRRTGSALSVRPRFPVASPPGLPDPVLPVSSHASLRSSPVPAGPGAPPPQSWDRAAAQKQSPSERMSDCRQQKRDRRTCSSTVNGDGECDDAEDMEHSGWDGVQHVVKDRELHISVSQSCCRKRFRLWWQRKCHRWSHRGSKPPKPPPRSLCRPEDMLTCSLHISQGCFSGSCFLLAPWSIFKAPSIVTKLPGDDVVGHVKA